MKFTKENVCGLIGRYRTHRNGAYRLHDLEKAVMNLDDTPEKVVVPKFVAEWYESQTSSSYNIRRMIEDLLNGSVSKEVVLIWLSKNYSKYGLRDRFDLLALIRINGYTIEPEKLYCIPLPHLETADGTNQYLTKSGSGNYFAFSPCVGQKQRYTKEELERVPEIYKPYAKLIEAVESYEKERGASE